MVVGNSLEDEQRVEHGKLAGHHEHDWEGGCRFFCDLVWRTWKVMFRVEREGKRQQVGEDTKLFEGYKGQLRR